MIMAYLKRYAEARKSGILDLHASNATTIPYMLHELLPSLTALHAASCRIPTLPPQLGLCSSITELKFDRSVLLSPPQGIVNRGTKDILKFLYGLHSAQASRIWYFYFCFQTRIWYFLFLLSKNTKLATPELP